MTECTQFAPVNALTTEVDFFTLNKGKEREEHKYIENGEEETILTILPFTTVHKTVWTFTSLVEKVQNQEVGAVMSGRLLVHSQACSSG
jgi:hypothetical protein